jgi:hypothetical protein
VFFGPPAEAGQQIAVLSFEEPREDVVVGFVSAPSAGELPLYSLADTDLLVCGSHTR